MVKIKAGEDGAVPATPVSRKRKSTAKKVDADAEKGEQTADGEEAGASPSKKARKPRASKKAAVKENDEGEEPGEEY